MTFVIGSPCIDTTDRSCVEQCPVDCIYVGKRKLYINPNECIECGACEPACPVSAIALDRYVPETDAAHVADNAAFFSVVLPGRNQPLGDPDGAAELGPVGVDTTLVARFPRTPDATDAKGR